jgi:O-Antigen ligase
LITAQDMAIRAKPVRRPAAQAVAIRPAGAAAPVSTVRERLLLIVLYISVLASSVAFIEPSPHDYMMGVLAFACLVAGVRFERRIAPLFIMLLIFNAGGLICLLNVPGQEKTIQFAATSLYLALAAVLYGCLFAENTMARLDTMRSAYILTAIFTTLLGLAAYYHLVPDHGTLTWADRVRSTFKDPNVFGPFLVLPALLLITSMITRGVRLLDFVATLILLVGILYSFSRGAWINFTVSSVVLLTLLFLTAPNTRARMRPIALALISAAIVALGIVALLSIHSVRSMLLERAQLQSYDVGQGGRFELQEIAIGVVLEHPLGLGPFEFSRIYGGTQQHNVYLQAFLVYGWLGGMAYITTVLTTLAVGLRSVFLRTPWQLYLIAAYAAFVGIVCESFVIDSDHWRHFFLILGIIWALAAANGRLLSGKIKFGGRMPAWGPA